MLNVLNITHVGLHSGDSGLNGLANELTSINYVRKSCSFSTTSNGARVLETPIVFSLSGGDSVSYVSYWNGSTFMLSQQVEMVEFSIPGEFRLNDTVTAISI